MSMICTPDVSDSTGRPHRAGIGAKLFGAVKRALLWPVHVAQARREIAKLARLSDHELRDIGLTSQDLRNASALPADVDPMRFLASTVAASARGSAKWYDR